MRGRLRAAACTLAIAGALVACRSRGLSPLYCEGGVGSKGETLGGECIAFSDKVIDADPSSVGAAHWLRAMPDSGYSVRRAGKERWELYAGGKLAGTIERDDHWIYVKIPGESIDRRLRDDAPGFFN